MSLSIAAQNLAQAAWNRAAKLCRRGAHWARRRGKEARESGKHVRAQARRGGERGRDLAIGRYASLVRTSRYWNRLRLRTWPAVVRDVSVRRTLRSVASGSAPILVGPWLSEVGYETLYWVPFVRWFARHYRIDPARLIALSRGGVSAWYGGIASRYVEQFDLCSPAEFAAHNEARQRQGDQKQFATNAFEKELLARARARLGLDDAHVCHPSAMFGLLRQFWLGNEALQSVFDCTEYAPVTTVAEVELPPLPDRFVAVKFYTGRALPDSPRHRERLRAIVEQIGRTSPVVTLNTHVAFDEHEDYVFKNVPGVITLDRWMTPQNNLGVQTEVIRRASRFVGTCGSLAWLAPMLGTDTLAVYADDHFLTSHLYAARHAYASIKAARFTPLDLAAFDLVSSGLPAAAAEQREPVKLQ